MALPLGTVYVMGRKMHHHQFENNLIENGSFLLLPSVSDVVGQLRSEVNELREQIETQNLVVAHLAEQFDENVLVINKLEQQQQYSQTQVNVLQNLVAALTERLDQNVSVINRLQSDVKTMEQKDEVQLGYTVKLERELYLHKRTSKLEYDKVNNAVISQERKQQQDFAYLQHMVVQSSQSMADLRGDKVRENNENRSQKQQIDKLKKTVEDLVEEQNGICAKVAGVANSVGFLKGLVPYNRWDPNACHKDLTLSGPERLFVQHNGEEPGHRCVFAKWPITKNHFDSFYYEIKVENKISFDEISIGIAPKHIKLDKNFGHYKSTYAYDSSGNIWENGNKLKNHRNRHNSECGGRAFVGKRVPLWGIGDVVGCGINLTTRQMIYTKNGERIEASNLFATDSVELYSCVTLCHSGDKIEANFGPNFTYKFEDDI